ncbi:MAG: hypothetical protein IAG10_00110 [Planctomycetaceae bacterium]|nr:hypothetical protein [Planctomycetaceae bacterium]
MLRIALRQDEWDAARNRLIVRRGLLGILRSRELSGGEFLLGPHFEQDRHAQQWRLAVICDGEKHYLIREPDIHVGFLSMRDSHAEASAVANLLAEHTGWTVSRSSIAIEGQWMPPTESNEEELLAALRSRRFVTEFDEQMRLTINPLKLGHWIGGLVLLAFGVGWLWILSDAVASFVNDAQAKQQPVLDIFFWLIMTPMLMIGVGLYALGVVCFFGCECWAVDRNLLLVRSRIFGWKSEHEYVNARWKLARVRRTSSEGQSYLVWQLQLENASGGQLKVLRSERDDDVPRLLGTLFSQRTGWSLSVSK